MLWNSRNIVSTKGLKKLRIAKLRQELSARKLDGIIIKSLPNIYYLSGFTSEDATLLITMEKSFLLTDFRYLEQAAKEAEHYEIIRVDNNLWKTIGKLAEGLRSIGIEEDSISWADFRIAQEVFGRGLLDAAGILRDLRQVKDEAELNIIREAVAITDQAFTDVLQKIRPGVTEEDLALELEFFLRKNGASGKSFEFIVASGNRSSLPHGTASSKKITSGEQITLDFGAKYHWYCSDITRTVFVGEPDAKYKEIYEIVLEAQQAALEIIKPGLTGKEVDSIARDIIRKYGYADYFGHGLGHSVGLEIHESPRFNTRDNTVLQPGMIMTVEPGIYIPDWGGVRIEDMVLVTKNGVEVLTQAPKHFIIID